MKKHDAFVDHMMSLQLRIMEMEMLIDVRDLLVKEGSLMLLQDQQVFFDCPAK